MRFVIRFLVSATLLIAAVAAAPAGSTTVSTTEVSNGISVGAPKVFDNRTLTIMLESLSQTLQSIQSQQFVDQKTLSAALLAIQGSRSAETNSAISVLGLPTPTTTQGIPSGGSTLTTTDVTRNSVTPTAPTLTDIPAFSGFTPTFGSSAGDLLSDSVNLNYQIFNLRMILERSLSDRLSEKHERLQTVLGFNITVDPPRTAVDSAAVVEITLRVSGEHPESAVPTADDLSLVALMPQEKTYNAAALNSKSNAFGGSAIVNAIQVGASTRRREQTFYLYRDNDTIAYERMTANKGELVFGWIFRPVLGRRSVSPGFRQLFAVVALPGADCKDSEAECHGGGAKKLVASVKTLWKKYDRQTLTTFEQHDANRAARFRYVATFGLARPEIFEARYLNSRDYPVFIVAPTHDYEESLRPTIEDVTWTPVGASNALITVAGEKFFTGTQVVMGDKTFGAADGLILKSNDTLQLVTTQDAIGAGPAVVSGRYAAPVPLVVPKAINKNKCDVPEIGLLDPEIGPSIGGKRKLTVKLARADSKPLLVGQLPDERHPPLITVNGHSAEQPYNIVQTDRLVLIETSVADESLDKGFVVLRISWPFLPTRLSVTRRTANPAAQYNVTRVGANRIFITAMNDAGFEKSVQDLTPLGPTQCWQVLAGDTPLTVRTSTCPPPASKTALAKSKPSKQSKKTADVEASAIGVGPNAISITVPAVPDRIVLVEPTLNSTFLLDVPKVNAAAAKADATGANTINQFDSVIVPITVAKAANVASVMADLKPLTFTPKSDKADETTIDVQITRDLSSKPGAVDITIMDKKGKPTNARLTINPVAKNGDEK